MDNYGLFIVVFAPFVVVASTVILYLNNLSVFKKLLPNTFLRISALFVCTVLIAVTAVTIFNTNDRFWMQIVASLSAVVGFMITGAVVVERFYKPSPKAQLWIVIIVCSFLMLILPFVWFNGVIVTIAYVACWVFLVRLKSKFPLMLQMMIAFLLMILSIVVFSYVNACMGYLAQA